MHLAYQVEVWIPDQHGWYPVGPVFTLRDDAVRYIDAVAPKDAAPKLPLRLVELTVTNTVSESESCVAPELSQTRLEFARHLFESGRINEGLEEAPAECPGEKAAAG